MNSSDCGRVFALLSEYLDGESAPATCEELEKHLGGCPECIEFVRSLKRSVALCRQYGDSVRSMPLEPEKMTRLRETYRKSLARERGAQASQSSEE